ncbi:unnamed protein product [Protopolystoma xenopodis]|uniref:Uncharacterized protein n=1 Tax=Protopolystoma xenopodis TaxID=117903 RepID=A0A448WCZ2_9PLAT|nr:unnamed protein product [Protopolystoma xenopodis]
MGFGETGPLCWTNGERTDGLVVTDTVRLEMGGNRIAASGRRVLLVQVEPVRKVAAHSQPGPGRDQTLIEIIANKCKFALDDKASSKPPSLSSLRRAEDPEEVGSLPANAKGDKGDRPETVKTTSLDVFGRDDTTWSISSTCAATQLIQLISSPPPKLATVPPTKLSREIHRNPATLRICEGCSGPHARSRFESDLEESEVAGEVGEGRLDCQGLDVKDDRD